MLNRDMPDGGLIPDRLHRFADRAAPSSPLYARISRAAAEEPIALRILAEAPHGQPAANILLAAVQFLMLDGVRHPLEGHYPSIGRGEPEGDSVELLFDFCRTYEDRIVEIVTHRTVQTNEVRRCIILLPAFTWVAQHRSSPLALLEIGSSAGLNLMFDRYRYDYGDGLTAGNPESPLTLTTELRSPTHPPPTSGAEVAWRRGIDLHPLDVTDPDDVLWGQALLWPEQVERIERYQKAVAIAAADPPHLVAGSALEALPEQLAAAPDGLALVVFHSFVLNQFTESERSRLGDLLAEASRSRPIDRISVEMLSRAAEHPEIVHVRYENGSPTSQVLGAGHHHGEWLHWAV